MIVNFFRAQLEQVCAWTRQGLVLGHPWWERCNCLQSRDQGKLLVSL